MPFTSHGHPYGLVLISDPAPVLVAKCGGPAVCESCSKEAHSPSPIDADSAAALVAMGWTPPADPVIKLTEEQPELPASDHGIEPWLTCWRCGTPVRRADDRLSVLMAAARQHTCPAQDSEQPANRTT